jgi:dCTP deaminase
VIFADITIADCLAQGHIILDPPPEPWQIQPASVELTLADEFLSPYEDKMVRFDRHYMIMPGECVLARTQQTVTLSSSIVARVEGKSSWGRRFLMIHSTAGFIDPGFSGTITLELVNLSKVSQALPIGEPIAQISFESTTVPVARPYGTPGLGSHYQRQKHVTPSAIPWQ